MPEARGYSSRRMAIVAALVTALKAINGLGSFRSNVNNNVEGRLRFWDEISDFPYISISAGQETRDYLGGGHRDRYLDVTIRVYVNSENALTQLEAVIEDVETVLEEGEPLAYTDRDGLSQRIQQISILSIDTDEGVLEPIGAAEISCQVRY